MTSWPRAIGLRTERTSLWTRRCWLRSLTKWVNCWSSGRTNNRWRERGPCMKARLKRSADNTYPMKPLDARGRRIRGGDFVRIVGLPDLSTMASATARRETGAEFRHVRGSCKRVSGFNKYGFVEVSFRILRGPNKGMHMLAVEPPLVIVQN